MEVFTLAIPANLENKRVEALAYPADRAVLFWNIAPLVQVIGMREDLPSFLEANPAFGIGPQLLALARIKMEPHDWYNNYTL